MTSVDLEPFAHLIPDARKVLDSSEAARFVFICRDKLIETPALRQVQQYGEELYAHAQIQRPPNGLLIGPSGIGKTHAISSLVDRHPPRRSRASGELRVPILLLEYPPEPSRRWFAKAIAEGLGYLMPLPRHSADIYALLLRLIDRARTRLIICEEVGQLHGWGREHVLYFYGLTRCLSNQTKVPIIYAGTDQAADLIDGDIQLKRRFEHLKLVPWKADAEFAGFIKAYLRTLPLRHETIVDLSLVECVHEMSEGITDTVVKILNRAAKRAIQSGAERITAVDIVAGVSLPPVVTVGRPIVRRRQRRR